MWVGAGAVALSAVFLFSYVVEQELLGPVPRVVLGLLLGAALIAGGEWTHRHPIARLSGAMPTDYVPQALTAAGVTLLDLPSQVGGALRDALGSDTKSGN